MIKTIEKAQRIQAKRRAAGKVGLSKAVRKFCKREGVRISLVM